MSWNVEAFSGSEAQLVNVASHIRSPELNPDVFGLFEVENVDIISLMSKHLPEYDYSLTDGPENKEILVGVRRGKFKQSVFSQKREFKAYNPYLRPGALITATLADEMYNIIFLHTASGTNAAGFGSRNEMFDKIWKLKKAIDRLATNNKGHLIVLGDLNTMGLQFPKPKKTDARVSEADEINALGLLGGECDMRLLAKEFSVTFNNLKEQSDLDHILASNDLKFTEFVTNEKKFHVKVSGWQQLKGEARKEFIQTISDHCSLYCEVA